jgi:hypothetical protein
MKEFIGFWQKFFSRQFIGLCITALLYIYGKQPDWVWFACFFVYVVGNKLDKYVDIVQKNADRKFGGHGHGEEES